ncbi:MAG: hypothetical protein Q4E46_00175 [Candidatus Saccharibacteria bacterium]|nr:hypothetical protein [Candidatus Saccharibacteria bacterium]
MGFLYGTFTSSYDGKVFESERERNSYDEQHFHPFGHECPSCDDKGYQAGSWFEPNHDCEECGGTHWLW